VTPGYDPTLFRATVVRHRGPATVRLAGELDYATKDELAAALAEVLADKPSLVVLEAHDLEFADVAGLRPVFELVDAASPVEVKVRGARLPIARLFGLLDLADLLD
jgi:anti-anti-sigma factor